MRQSARGAANSSRPARVRKAERARPEPPPDAEPPDAPLGAGPGAGLEGWLPSFVVPWPLSGGVPSLPAAVHGAVAVASAVAGAGSRLRGASKLTAQLLVIVPSSAESLQPSPVCRCGVAMRATVLGESS